MVAVVEKETRLAASDSGHIPGSKDFTRAGHQLILKVGDDMAQQPQGVQVTRLFDQHPEALSFYSDFSQIVGTDNEIYLQFYETIPSPPNASGQVTQVRTRLRATIAMSRPHSLTMARNLLQQIGTGGAPGQTGGAPGPAGSQS